MTNDQFCYWLQGYFELRDGDAPLGEGQIKIILAHVDVCEEYTKTRGGIGPAVLAIRALLSTSTDCTAAVQKILHDVFEHVIDPKAGDAETQSTLNGLHGWKPGKPVLRC